jgi:hypothetical protein
MLNRASAQPERGRGSSPAKHGDFSRKTPLLFLFLNILRFAFLLAAIILRC